MPIPRGLSLSESAIFKAEPFPLTATVPFSSDTRTRVLLFWQWISNCLPGEGAKRLYRRRAGTRPVSYYPLRIEFMGPGASLPRHHDVHRQTRRRHR